MVKRGGLGFCFLSLFLFSFLSLSLWVLFSSSSSSLFLSLWFSSLSRLALTTMQRELNTKKRQFWKEGGESTIYKATSFFYVDIFWNFLFFGKKIIFVVILSFELKNEKEGKVRWLRSEKGCFRLDIYTFLLWRLQVTTFSLLIVVTKKVRLIDRQQKLNRILPLCKIYCSCQSGPKFLNWRTDYCFSLNYYYLKFKIYYTLIYLTWIKSIIW